MEPIVFGKEWFDKYQGKLVCFANTKFGRYSLRIHGKRSDIGKNKITSIAPNSVTWREGHKYKTEFRTDAKFSKRLYNAFKPLWWAFHVWDMAIANNLNLALNLGFDTLTSYPDPASGATTVDGIVYRVSGSAVSLSTLRSGTGTNVATTNSTTFNKQYVNLTNSTTGGYDQLIRSVFTFDTSSMTSDAIITAATASFYGEAKQDDYSMTATQAQLRLVAADPQSNNDLVATDFNIARFGSTSLATAISYASYNTSAYNVFTLNDTGLENISTTGISKFGLRMGADVDNSSPGGTGTAGNSFFLRGLFADVTGTTQDPKLVVTYSIAPPVADLKDDFNDNSLDTSIWETSADGGATITETNQRIQIVLAPSTNSSGGLYAKDDDIGYNFTNGSVSVEVLQVPNTTSSTFVDLWITFPPYAHIWRLINGNLVAARGGVPDLASLTYNPVTHRWWRIRHSTSTIFWDTSADGLTWTNHASYSSSGVELISTFPQMVAVTGVAANPGSLYFDNFNIQAALITLTGTSSTSFTPKATYYPDVSLDGTTDLSVYGTLVTDQSSTIKSYLYKVYDVNDNFLGLWNDVVSELNYSQEINSAGSSIQVELARTSDTRFVDFDDLFTTQTPEAITTTDGNVIVLKPETDNNIGPGSDVDVNYRVEVWVFYGSQESLETTSGELILTNDSQEIIMSLGAVNGLRKFNGYITRYISRYGSTDSVLVSIASFGRELDNHVLKSGSNTTVTYSSVAPNTILTGSLDTFNSQGGIVSYTSSSIEATGTTVSYTFRLNTFLEVIQKCLELAPYDWFWYVGLGDDTVYFKARSATPSHYFILGEHIESLELEYNIEDITNLVYFTGDETADVALFKTYTDETSISNYRQGLKRISDHRVSLSASADLIGQREIDRNDTPRYRSSITILSEAYPIDEITLGQVIGFRNFGNYIDEVTMQIVAIDYEPDKVWLQLDTLLPRVNKRIEDLTRNMVELDNKNIPSAPS